MTMLLPLWKPVGPGSLWVTPPGLGMSRTGHAGKCKGGCWDVVLRCIGLMLRAPTPANRQCLRANKVCREQKARGATWQALVGTSAWCWQQAQGQRRRGQWGEQAGHGPYGQGSTPHRWLGLVSIIPHGPAPSKRGHPHCGGCRGLGADGGEGQGWIRGPQNKGAGNEGPGEESDRRRWGAVG